jgi:hypothetical protein
MENHDLTSRVIDATEKEQLEIHEIPIVVITST